MPQSSKSYSFSYSRGILKQRLPDSKNEQIVFGGMLKRVFHIQ